MGFKLKMLSFNNNTVKKTKQIFLSINQHKHLGEKLNFKKCLCTRVAHICNNYFMSVKIDFKCMLFNVVSDF